jgi:lipoprotein signal peptidase
VLRLFHGLPLFAGLLLLDQLLKVAALALLGAGNPFAALPVVALVAQVNEGTLFGFGAGVSSALRWPAVATGCVLLGLLWLGGRAERASEGAEGAGWWLCAVGVTGNLVDRLWFGGVIELLHFNLGPVILSLNLADVLFVAGLVLLARDTAVRMTTPRHSQVPLSSPPEPLPDLGSLPRGIDNVRIDVRLSPQFEAAARRLLSSLLYQHIGHERYGAKPTPPSRQEFTDFRTAYSALIGAVVRLAKQEQRPYPVVLTQLAVLKFLSAEVTREFDVQIGHLRGILGSDAKGGRKMLLHEHITALAQRRRTIELQARIQLSDEIKRVETGAGVKLRESLLGQAWVIDESVLFNPLLAAGDPQDPQVAMRHYVLLGKRTADWDALTRFEAYVERLVSRAAPEGVQDGAGAEHGSSWLAGSDWAARAELLGLGPESGEVEHNPLTDVPINADILFNTTFLDAWLDEVRREGDAKTERQLRDQRRL